MSELDEYHQNLMADIRREADASGVFPVEAFFDRMTERLTRPGQKFCKVAGQESLSHRQAGKLLED